MIWGYHYFWKHPYNTKCLNLNMLLCFRLQILKPSPMFRCQYRLLKSIIPSARAPLPQNFWNLCLFSFPESTDAKNEIMNSGQKFGLVIFRSPSSLNLWEVYLLLYCILVLPCLFGMACPASAWCLPCVATNQQEPTKWQCLHSPRKREHLTCTGCSKGS